jgi:hypothetical protein
MGARSSLAGERCLSCEETGFDWEEARRQDALIADAVPARPASAYFDELRSASSQS